MPSTLPGMPLAAADVHVCKIDDGAPRLLAERTPPPLRVVRPGIWLVLALCPHCWPRAGRYCSDHDATNWWLTHYRR